VRPDAAARAELRRASRERRRFERAEVRRFTRRARNRRIAVGISLGIVASLVLLVFAAIFSPLLALRQITVSGTSRVSADEVHQAIDGQLGVPLALIDYGRLTAELGSFPLIRSYVTEIVPPDTLLVHVTERQPVGSLVVNSAYQLVDPAGVTVQESAERVAGVPVIDIGGASTTSPVFESVVAVLLSLPPGLLAQVDSVTARTPDDVSLVLTGVGQRVTWGAAVESARKASLLAALIAVTDPSLAGEFDVSAPGNGVFRPS
jgi:cell division protein FtsQ